MSGRYGNAQAGEFIPGLVLPPMVQGRLRQLLTKIETADTPVNMLLAQERAIGLVDGLELVSALLPADCERLHLVIDKVTTTRLQALQLPDAAK